MYPYSTIRETREPLRKDYLVMKNYQYSNKQDLLALGQ